MKKGLFTTEFWLSLLSVVLPSALQGLEGSSDPVLAAIGAAVAGIYTASRAVVKAIEAKKK